VKDKEIIYIFDQNVNVVIQGLANMSGRTFEDILSLLKDGRFKLGSGCGFLFGSSLSTTI
jgi:hypothetical protein